MDATAQYANALKPGTRLNGTEPGQYEILGVLGAGGFSITYKARDKLLDTIVAIKEYLPSDFALRHHDGTTVGPRSSSEATQFEWGLERFLDEARTLKKFREQHIVRVESFLQANGTAYMIMEYEEGQTLESFLNEGHLLSERELLAMIMPVLKGLQVVHDNHYLHRDIKPGNIYLRTRGGPVLLDFGAARQALVEQSQPLTSMLTAGYAPFEQYSNSRTLTPSTDLYAIGATLYRCIAGRRPVDSPERINALHHDEADPCLPAVIVGQGSYSRSLLEAVDWCLAPLAKDRPQTVGELIEALAVSSARMGQPLEQTLRADRMSGRSHSVSADAVTRRRGMRPLTTVLDARTGWKALFVCVLVGVSVAAPLGFFTLSNSSSGALIAHMLAWSLWCLFASIPLYGFAYHKALLSRSFWRGAWAVAAIALVADAWFTLNGLAEFDPAAWYKTWLYVLVAGLLLMPFSRYAFADEYCWKPVDPVDPAPVYRNRRGSAVGWGLVLLAVILPVFGIGLLNSAQLKKAIALYDKSEFVAAYEILLPMAEQGNAQAQFFLGKMYRYGLGKSANPRQAQKWFDQAIKNDVVNIMKKEARRGDASSQSNLGVMYYEGLGVDRDPEAAANWNRQSAEQGYAIGQSNYAAQLLHGIGVQKNSQQAAFWYGKAAEQEYTQAQHALAMLYYAGDGVARDYEKARYWFEKAAKSGFIASKVGLGTLYLEGLGVEKDPAIAERLYRQAADAEDPNGQRSLANMYARGNGLPQDKTQAILWYQRAAEQGDAIAQNELGYFYGVGDGVARDHEKAVFWYRKAAEQDNTTAQYNLGVMYETGAGVIKSMSDATYWYQRAARRNHAEARQALERLINQP